MRSVYTSAAFWRGAGERAVKTGAQAASALIVAETTSILDVPWPAVLSVTALAMLGSLLTSLSRPEFTAGVPEGGETAYVPEAGAYGPQEEPQARTRDERHAREAQEHDG